MTAKPLISLAPIPHREKVRASNLLNPQHILSGALCRIAYGKQPRIRVEA
jgi:hypothetical protein